MLKRKSDVLEKFKFFKAQFKIKRDLKIKYLHTNNREEFYSKKFEAFCNEHGIKRYLTILELYNRNDVTERMNKILMKYARSMLIIARLEKRFFG